VVISRGFDDIAQIETEQIQLIVIKPTECLLCTRNAYHVNGKVDRSMKRCYAEASEVLYNSLYKRTQSLGKTSY